MKVKIIFIDNGTAIFNQCAGIEIVDNILTVKEVEDTPIDYKETMRYVKSVEILNGGSKC